MPVFSQLSAQLLEEETWGWGKGKGLVACLGGIMGAPDAKLFSVILEKCQWRKNCTVPGAGRGLSVSSFPAPPPTPASSRGPVLAVAMGSNSEYCYSGGADARIHSWKIPDLNMDPYDGYGETASSLGLPFPCLSSTGASLFPQHM